MSDSILGLKITGGLNYGLSLDQINKDLRILSRHPSLQKLKINISIDENFIKNLSSFSKNLNIITQQLNQQNSANDKLNKGLNNTTQTIQNQTNATNEAIAAEKRWQTEREKTNSKGIKTITYGNTANNDKQVVTTMPDGSIKNIDNIKNQLKDMKETQSLADQIANGRIASATRVRDFERQWNENQQAAIQNNANIERAEIAKTQQTRKAYEEWYLKAIREREIQDTKTYTNLNSKLTSGRSNSMTGVESTKALDLLNRKYGEVAQRITSLQSSGRHLTDSEVSGINRRIQALNGLAARQMQVEKELASIKSKAEQKVSNSNAGNAEIARMKELLTQLKAINTATPDFQNKAKGLSDAINRIGREATASSGHTRTFGDSLKRAFTNVLMYSGVGSIFFGVTNAIRSGIKYVYELDTAMTNLRKVTDETTSTYNRFLVSANNTANSIGGVTLDVVKATTEWARLGYTIQQAQSLAKETLIYQNVGDLGSAEEASKSLISTMKGFNMEVDAESKNITHIVDVFNEVGNRYAISSGGIGEALRRSAASMYESGNTIEQAVALATAANSTIQDPARVGQMLKTVSMRLRGVSDEGEDLTDLVPTLEKKFSALGLTLKKDDETFKSTYEIFESLSSVWGDMNDFQRADILESVAGKLQGNIAASLINDFETAQKSLNTALNSTGSAARENEKYINSIAGRMNLLKNSISDYWNSSIDSGFVKGAIDLVSSLIKHLGNLGNTLGMVTLAFVVLKTKAIAGLYTYLYNTIGALVATTYAAGATATAMNILGKSLTLGWIGVAAGALYILYDVMRGNEKVIEKQNDLIEKSNKKYSELGSKLDEVSNYYKENHDVISTNTEVKDKLFQMQNELIDSFGLEAKGIDLVNGKYDEQIEKIEKLKKNALDNQIKDSQIIVDSTNSKNRNFSGTPTVGSNGFGGYRITNGDTKDLTGKEYYEELQKRYEEILNSSAKAFASQKLLPKSAEEWEKALNVVKDEMEKFKPIYDQMIQLEDLKKEKIKQTSIEQNNFGKDQLKLFHQLTATLSKQPIDQFSASLSYSAEIIKSFDGTNIAKVIDELKKLPSISINPEVVSALDGIKDKAAETASKTNQLNDFMKELNTSFKETSDAVSPLNAAIQKLKEGKSLTADEIVNLIEKEEGFSAAVTEENGILKVNLDAITTLRDGKIKSFNDMIKAKEAELSAQETATIKELELYGIQIDGIKSVAEAMEALAGKREEVNKNTYTMLHADLKNDPEGKKYLKSLQEETSGIIKAQQSLSAIDKARKKLNDLKEISSTTLETVGTPDPDKDKSKADKDAADFKDATESRIAAINALAEAQAKLNDTYSSASSSAESANKFADAIANQNKLIDGQVTQINELNKANVKLSSERQALQKSSGYSVKTMSSWIGTNGEASESFTKLYNSMGSGTAQKNLQAIFDKYKLFTDAIKTNNETIVTTTAEQTESKSHLREQYFAQSEKYITDETDKMRMAGKSEIDIAKFVFDARKRMANEKWTTEKNIAKLTSDEQISADKAVYEASKEYNKKRIEDTQRRIDKIDKLISASSSKLKALNGNMADPLNGSYKVGSLSAYNSELLNNIGLLQQKQAQEQLIESNLRSQMEAVNTTKDDWEDFNAQLIDSVQRQIDIANAISDTSKSIIEQQQNLANDIVSLIKEGYEKQKEIAIDIIDEQIEAINKESEAFQEAQDKKVEALDEEISKLEEVYSARMDLIDKQESEEDYTKKLSKAQKDAQKTKDDIAALSRSDDLTDKARRKALEETLADQLESIADMQHDHEIDLRKKSLQDELDVKKKELDKAKSTEQEKIKANEASVNAQKKLLEDLKLTQQKHYDELLNNERVFYQLKQEIMNGNYTNATAQLETLKVFYQANTSLIGSSISNNMIDKISLMNTRMSEAASTLSSKFIDINNTIQSTLIATLNTLIQKLSDISKMSFSINTGTTNSPSPSNSTTGTVTPSNPSNQQTYLDNLQSGSNSGAAAWANQYEYLNNLTKSDNPGQVKWAEAEMKKNGMKQYHVGGVVGGSSTNIGSAIHKAFNLNDSEEMAKLLKKEIVINPDNFKPIDFAKGLFGNIKLPSFKGNDASPSVVEQKGNIIQGGITFSFPGFAGSKNEGKAAVKYMVNELNKLGFDF